MQKMFCFVCCFGFCFTFFFYLFFPTWYVLFFTVCTGRCPFLAPSAAQTIVHYSISSEENQSVLLRCADSTEVHVDCGVGGQWELNSTEVCARVPTTVDGSYINTTFCIIIIMMITIFAERLTFCGVPVAPTNGKILSVTNTSKDAIVTFQCDEGFIPSTLLLATCKLGAVWEPDPENHKCTALLNISKQFNILISILISYFLEY